MASVRILVVVSVLSAISSCIAEDVPSDSNSCENICLLTVNGTQAADNVGYCARGCRLMRLVDFANEGGNTLDDLLQMCLQSCNSAYGDAESTVITACQSGCNAQLPFVADRRRQLALFYQEAEQYFEIMEWLNAIMNCFGNRLQQEGDTEGYYIRARILVISSSANGEETVAGSIRGETGAADDELNRVSMSQDDWIDCMSQGSGMSRRLLIVAFGIGFFVFTFIVLVVCCPLCLGSKPAFNQTAKLSIYGDGEVLKTLGEDDEELLLREKPAAEEPRMILMKIPIHSV